MNIGDRIRQLRDSAGLTQEDVGNRIGVTKATVNRYETGEIDIKRTIAIKLAEALNTTPQYIMGWEDVDTSKSKSPAITDDCVVFPVIGDIAAGYEMIAFEDWDGETVAIPGTYLKGRKKEEFFVLTVKGDSMYPLYHDGDRVLVLKQSTLNHSGQIGAVIYNDEMATLKKVEYVNGENWLKLIPINPEYKPRKIENEELEHCHVIGVPKLLIREV